MPSDMQLSNAIDENPAMIHTGLASILPGKTVHAHVSDKPSNKKPGISKPSVNAALQVQNEAKKQHEKRLEALKIKLKKLRERLEKLQQVGTKQDKIESRKEKDVEEIKTLNELRVATKDAIKELHDDYPRAKKKQLTCTCKKGTSEFSTIAYVVSHSQYATIASKQIQNLFYEHITIICSFC